MEIFIRGLVALGIAMAVAAVARSHEPGAALPPAPVGPAGPVAGQPYYGPGAPVYDNGTGWSPFMRFYHQRTGQVKPDAGFGIQPLHRKKQKLGGLKTQITQPGTLVFPQHPFARSPRDFWMID